MDDGGWVPIAVLAHRVGRSVGALCMIAAMDSKGRFQLAHYRVGGEPRSVLLIRATQGHSISGVLDHRLFVRPDMDDVFRWPVLVHASHYECVLDMLRCGLLPGGAMRSPEESRNYCHFTPLRPDDARVVCRSRKSARVHIYFNKWMVLCHCDLWMTPSMAVLTGQALFRGKPLRSSSTRVRPCSASCTTLAWPTLMWRSPRTCSVGITMSGVMHA